MKLGGATLFVNFRAESDSDILFVFFNAEFFLQPQRFGLRSKTCSLATSWYQFPPRDIVDDDLDLPPFLRKKKSNTAILPETSKPTARRDLWIVHPSDSRSIRNKKKSKIILSKTTGKSNRQNTVHGVTSEVISAISKYRGWITLTVIVQAVLLFFFYQVWSVIEICRDNIHITNHSSETIYLHSTNYDFEGSVDDVISIDSGATITVKSESAWNGDKQLEFFLIPDSRVQNFAQFAPESSWTLLQENGETKVTGNFIVISSLISNYVKVSDFNDVTDEELRNSAPTIESASSKADFMCFSMLPYEFEALFIGNDLSRDWVTIDAAEVNEFDVTPFINANKSDQLKIEVRFPDEELLREVLFNGDEKSQSDIAKAVLGELSQFELSAGKAFLNLKLLDIRRNGRTFGAYIKDPHEESVGTVKLSTEERLFQARKKKKLMRSEAKLHLVNLSPFHLKAVVSASKNPREVNIRVVDLAPASSKFIHQKFLYVESNFKARAISTREDREYVSTLTYGKHEYYVWPLKNSLEELIYHNKFFDELDLVAKDNKGEVSLTYLKSEIRSRAEMVDIPFADLEAGHDGNFSSVFIAEEMGDAKKLAETDLEELPGEILQAFGASTLKFRRALEMRANYLDKWAKYEFIPMFFPATFSEDNDQNAPGLLIDSVPQTVCGADNQLQVGDVLLQLEGEQIFGEKEVSYIINQRAFQTGVKVPLKFV